MATQDPSSSERYPNRDPDRPLDHGSSGGGWMVAIIAIVIVGLVALMASRLWTDRDADVTARDLTDPYPGAPTAPPPINRIETDSAIPAAGVQAAEPTLLTLTQDAPRYHGQTVNVQGVVKRVIGPSAFTIATNANAGEEVLVVQQADTQTPGPDAMQAQTPGKRVRVAGQFKTYDQDQVQQTLGNRFEQGQFNDFNNKPMISATSVQPLGDVAP